jgi:hypothetical protein
MFSTPGLFVAAEALDVITELASQNLGEIAHISGDTKAFA